MSAKCQIEPFRQIQNKIEKIILKYIVKNKLKNLKQNYQNIHFKILNMLGSGRSGSVRRGPGRGSGLVECGLGGGGPG